MRPFDLNKGNMLPEKKPPHRQKSRSLRPLLMFAVFTDVLLHASKNNSYSRWESRTKQDLKGVFSSAVLGTNCSDTREHMPHKYVR